MTSHSYSTPMHQHMAWAPYSYKRETSTHKNPQNPTSTLLLTTRRCLHRPREIMISTNENYWQSLKPYNTGDHTLPGRHTPSCSLLTTPISCSGSTLER